jgi:hypothetical protein
VLGLGGRAYLGKGALKGRLTADSVIIYFPTRGEYVEEEVADFFRKLDCPLALTGSDILTFFRRRPMAADLPDGVKVVTDETDKDEPSYVISSVSCPWRIELTYDSQKNGWRLAEFSYDSGDGLRIEAKRREYRPESSVRMTKFLVDIPPGAVLVEP